MSGKNDKMICEKRYSDTLNALVRSLLFMRDASVADVVNAMSKIDSVVAALNRVSASVDDNYIDTAVNNLLTTLINDLPDDSVYENTVLLIVSKFTTEVFSSILSKKFDEPQRPDYTGYA